MVSFACPILYNIPQLIIYMILVRLLFLNIIILIIITPFLSEELSPRYQFGHCVWDISFLATYMTIWYVARIFVSKFWVHIDWWWVSGLRHIPCTLSNFAFITYSYYWYHAFMYGLWNIVYSSFHTTKMVMGFSLSGIPYMLMSSHLWYDINVLILFVYVYKYLCIQVCHSNTMGDGFLFTRHSIHVTYYRISDTTFCLQIPYVYVWFTIKPLCTFIYISSSFVFVLSYM